MADWDVVSEQPAGPAPAPRIAAPPTAPGGWDVVAEQPAAPPKRDVGVLESASRLGQAGLREITKGSELVTAAPAVLLDKLHGLFTGRQETGLQDEIFRDYVAPEDETIHRLAIDQATEHQALPAKVVGEVAHMVPALGMMAATGGASAEPAAADAVGTIGQRILTALQHAGAASAGPGLIAGGERAQQRPDTDIAHAAGDIVTGYGQTVAQNTLPMAAPVSAGAGKLAAIAQRAAGGAVAMPAVSGTVAAVEGRPYEGDQALADSILGALTAQLHTDRTAPFDLRREPAPAANALTPDEIAQGNAALAAAHEPAPSAPPVVPRQDTAAPAAGPDPMEAVIRDAIDAFHRGPEAPAPRTREQNRDERAAALEKSQNRNLDPAERTAARDDMERLDQEYLANRWHLDQSTPPAPAHAADVTPPIEPTRPMTMPAPPRPTTPVEVPPDRTPPPDRLAPAQEAAHGDVAVAEQTPAPAEPDYLTRMRELQAKRAQGPLTPEESSELIDLHERDARTARLAGSGMRLPGVQTMAEEAAATPEHKAFADLDNFKQVNDLIGHGAGDEVIAQVAGLLAQRFPDRVFHKGGDEFVLHGSPDDLAAGMADIRATLANTPIEVTGADGETRTLPGLGVSYGLGDTIDAADANLKADKRTRLDAGLRTERRATDRGTDAGHEASGDHPVEAPAGAERAPADRAADVAEVPAARPAAEAPRPEEVAGDGRLSDAERERIRNTPASQRTDEDIRRYNADHKLREEERLRPQREAEAAREAEQKDLDGFDNGMTPMQQSKAREILNKPVSVNGRMQPRKQHIRDLVAAGAKVTENSEGRVLQKPDGTYLTQKDLGKTALDYAEHLIENGRSKTVESAPPAPEPAPAPTAGDKPAAEVPAATQPTSEAPPAPPSERPQRRAEGEPAPEDVTGIKHDQVDAERAAKGQDQLHYDGERTFGDAWHTAGEKLAADPQAGTALAQSILAKPRPLSAEESALLLHDRVRLHNEHRAAQREVEAAIDSGDTAAEALARGRMKVAEDGMEINDRASRASGYEQGFGLAARRMLAKMDYTLAALVARAKIAAGRDLHPEERAKLEGMQKRIADLETQLAEKVKATRERKATPVSPKDKAAADAAFTDLAKQLKAIREKDQMQGCAA